MKFDGIRDIVIIGAGGFGREVCWLIEEINKIEKKFNILGFIDDNLDKKRENINGYNVLGDINYLNGKENIYFACAIGNTEVKKSMIQKALSFGIKPQTLIHPSVICGGINEIGKGSIICAGSIITTNVIIKDYVTINLLCTVGHDSIIEEYCTLYPSVNISGNCIIGKSSEIGTKTAIIQGLKLGQKTITGAGAVVVKNMEGNCTVVGVPAKIISTN